MINLGRFGMAAEFNNLGVGSLVSPLTALGLRPTFRIGLGFGGHARGFYASPYPALTNYIQNGFDWLIGWPVNGSVVHVSPTTPVNILCSVPFLISAPVPLTPVYPDNLTAAEWQGAGLDPSRQALEWRLQDGRRFKLSVNLNGQRFRLINPNVAQYISSNSRSDFPFTSGLPVDPGQDFVAVSHMFGCLPLEDQFLPAGQYRFRIDLAVIPRGLAYESSNQIPEVNWFRNMNLSQVQNYPTASIDIVGDMPSNLPIPRITNMSPQRGRPGDVVEFTGNLLGRTQAVSFSPDAQSQFEVVSDSRVRATVSRLADSGIVVLETARGFAVTNDEFEVLEQVAIRGRGSDKVE